MKRRKSTTSSGMSKFKLPASRSLNGEPVRLPVLIDESSTQVRPGVVLVDGCEVVGSKSTKAVVDVSADLAQMADLSLNKSKSEETQLDVDFNDVFPDEILLQIFKYCWSPVHCWEAAKVCKRWCVLQACNQLYKRSNHISGRFPCMVSQKVDGVPRKPHCNGSSKTLKLNKVESEWRLAMDFLESCKRHTHSLEIKDCTHVSLRGYQLVSSFASNLKSIRLESCNSMDDPSLDAMLDRCSILRTIHLSLVPNLTLRNVDKKAPNLQELHVYGCRLVTRTTILALLKGCPHLRSLCLSAMGGSHEWDECKIEQVPPMRLQTLELANTSAVNTGFLQALSKCLSNVRKLDLSNCPLVTDDGLKAMIASCGMHLQKLIVTRCPQISDDSVRALAGVAANLQDLSLAGTNVSDDGLQALMESKAVVLKLRNLSMACCQRLTDAGLQHFILRHRQLVSFRVLDVQGCHEVSASGLNALQASINKEKKQKLVCDKVNV